MEKEMDIFFRKILASLNDKFKGNWNITDNKAEGRISKRVFQENRARQIFWKTNISYPYDFFGKFGVLCFL